MRRSLLIVTSILSMSLVSCDKAKELVGKASNALKKGSGAKDADTGSEVDATQQKLVDQNSEGVIFRKDLPFPQRLEVRTTIEREMSGRFYQTSEIEKHLNEVKGTRIFVTKLERSGNHVRYTLEQAGFSNPLEQSNDEKKLVADPFKQDAPTNQPVTFQKAGNDWKAAEGSGFRATVLSKQLSPVLADLLVENALAPRPLWFGKRRMKIGEQLVVSDSTLPMLLVGNASGKFTLKLESFEPVAGHPCGVFSISGDFSRKKFPDFEGVFTDEEVTIQAGKIWLSLVYPIILKEEFDTIQSFTSGGKGGLTEKGQGAVKVSVRREWKILKP
ncbi:MAG: hypothetical protein H8M99_02840 [Gloeobacteraceae cyanobacterium ES-bin-144]|nr:hypothetical protein [Verrucomicrobiales bacterium]